MNSLIRIKSLRAGGLAATLIALIAVSCTAITVQSAPIMPDYATLPTGWTTDRYEPASFVNVGTYQGRNNVLGISIDATTGQPARPIGQQGLFYTTQGRKFTFSSPEGSGSVLAADLYIPASWGNSANGHVRTDMWGTMVDAGAVISAYPIIGFSNYGGVPRLRVYDGDLPGGWVDLSTTITYDTWTAFAIELLADTSINYYVNGVLVYTDSTTGSSVAFKEVIMQAYNFEHTDIPSPIVVPYTALWANTPAPAPSDFTITPCSPVFVSNHVVGVVGDAAPGFGTGSFASDGVLKTDMYFTPEALFGRAVKVGQVARLSYWTKKGTTHVVNAADWFLAIYTKPFAGDVSTPTWYGSRFGSEPYFSINLADPANTWNQWTTDGENNQLRFFESTQGAPGATFGSYTDPEWTTFLAGNSLGTTVPRASQEVLYFSIQTGSAWAAVFTGQVDGFSIELNDGSVATVNFEPSAPPVASEAVAAPSPVAYNYLGNVSVTAKITTTGDCGPITSAQFSVNGGPWNPMAATDSLFNSASEGVTGTFTLVGAGIAAPGVYDVCVRGYDAAGNVSNEDCILLVVYDPNGGFVTGGGWIDSPSGAYTLDADLIGKATFGFVSQYKKGASVPTGSTEFQFKVADLNFHSKTYQWLVVAGARAQYKGVGTINGAGNFGFLLTAIDGQISGGGGVDKFRIKIWDQDNGNVIVYDNKPTSSDTSNDSTALGGGSIVIHKK